MKKFSKEDIKKIAETDDLHIAPFREDGKTYGTLTWIWSVVVDNILFVRAYHGIDSSWYHAAMQQKAGKIKAAGMTKKVNFEPVHGEMNKRIDRAYKSKYHDSPFMKDMIGKKARDATVKISPAE
jgi:hypothetical protein